MSLENPHTWPRLYLSQDLRAVGDVEISAESTHYLVHVLRARMGEPVRLFNERDGEWLARLQNQPKGRKDNAILRLERQWRVPCPAPDLWLCAAPIKKNHFDFMIQKATELGVSVIQPVLTERTQIREINAQRLRTIAIEAAEQSERLDVPEVREAVTLSQLISTWPANRHPIICAEFGQAQSPIKAMQNAPAQAAIFIGPEGGYTKNEMERICALPQACALRLGPRILRADTAALAALSCWQALCGDWRESKKDT